MISGSIVNDPCGVDEIKHVLVLPNLASIVIDVDVDADFSDF